MPVSVHVHACDCICFIKSFILLLSISKLQAKMLMKKIYFYGKYMTL